MSVSGNILDSDPAGDSQLPVWEAHYRSEDQEPLLRALEAGFSDRRILEAHYPLVRLLGKIPCPLRSSIELGCGSGAFSLVLKKLGLVEEVTLLDYSIASLTTAQELFKHFDMECDLVHSTIGEAPFRAKAFELALSAGVIEHYRSRAARYSCMSKHLELASYAFLQAPVSSPFYWLSRTVYTAMNRGWPFGFERPVGIFEMHRLARRTGARVIGHDHQYFTSFPLFTRLHWLPMPGWYTIPFANEVAILARSQR
jgi:SAM-dependent methyltransferase